MFFDALYLLFVQENKERMLTEWKNVFHSIIMLLQKYCAYLTVTLYTKLNLISFLCY